MGGIGGLFGGGKSKSVSTSRVIIPSFLEPYITGLPEEIDALSRRDYPGYPTQDRIEPLTADELAAHELIRNYVAQQPGGFENLVSQAQSLGERYLAGPTTQDIQARQSPYIEAVLNRTQENLRRGLGTQLNAIGSQAADVGAFGGSRQAVYEAEAAGAANRNFADVTASLLDQSYNQALDAYYAGLQGAGTSLQQQGAFSQAGLADAVQRGAALENIGGTQRQLGQAQRDLDYQEFINEFNFPQQQLDARTASLLNILQLTRGEQNVQTSKQGGGSAIGNILGAGLALASPLGAFGGSSLFGLGASGLSSLVPSLASPLNSFAQSSLGRFAFGNQGVYGPIRGFKDGGFVGAVNSYLDRLRQGIEGLDISDELPRKPGRSFLERITEGATASGGSLFADAFKAPGQAIKVAKEKLFSPDFTQDTEAALASLTEEDIAAMTSEEIDALNRALSQKQRRKLEPTDEAAFETGGESLVEPLAQLVAPVLTPAPMPVRPAGGAASAPSKDVEVQVQPSARIESGRRRDSLPQLAFAAALLGPGNFATQLSNALNAYAGTTAAMEKEEIERKMEEAKLALEAKRIDTQNRFADAQLQFAAQKARGDAAPKPRDPLEDELTRAKTLETLAGALENPNLSEAARLSLERQVEALSDPTGERQKEKELKRALLLNFFSTQQK